MQPGVTRSRLRRARSRAVETSCTAKNPSPRSGLPASTICTDLEGGSGAGGAAGGRGGGQANASHNALGQEANQRGLRLEPETSCGKVREQEQSSSEEEKGKVQSVAKVEDKEKKRQTKAMKQQEDQTKA